MASFFPSCTEHEEIEIATLQLETDETSGASGDRLHVLVEKHRGRRDRQPTSSSPRPPPHSAPLCERCRSAAAGRSAVAGATPMQAAPKDTTDERTMPRDSAVKENNKQWKLFRDACVERGCGEGPQPALVEVYRFERGDAQYMVTAGAAPPGACERFAERASRATAGALASVAGAAGTLLSLPVVVALAVQSAALRSVRGLATGCVQNMSDYVLKPALAVTFNAVLRPALVFVAHVGGAVREAVRPLALAGADCVEPVVRLLAAVRLVEVRMSPRCSCHTVTRDAL